MSRLLSVLAIAALIASVAPAAAQTHGPPQAEAEPPPLGPGRVLGMLALGGLTGLGGSIPGLYAGAYLEIELTDCDGDYCGLGGALLGAYAGYTLAAPFGVYGAGSAGDQSGSLGSTFAGGLAGGGIGLLGAAGIALLGPPDDLTGVLVGALLLGSAPVGAIIGFSRSRRLDRPAAPPRIGALVMLDDGGLRLGAPIPAIAPSADGFAMHLPIAIGAL